MNVSQDAPQVLTLAQVAEHLQLAERTVLKMAQRGEIPAAKIASQWRFVRAIIDDWLVTRMSSPAGREPEPAAGPLDLSVVLRPEFVLLQLRPEPRDGVLKQLINPLVSSGYIRDGGLLLRVLIEREELMSTCIGFGVAIPHPRTPLNGLFPAPAVAVGRCPGGVDFGAPDGRPTDVFFLVCATDLSVHLRLMSKVARFASREDLMARLRKATHVKEVTDALEGLKQPG